MKRKDEKISLVCTAGRWEWASDQRLLQLVFAKVQGEKRDLNFCFKKKKGQKALGRFFVKQAIY